MFADSFYESPWANRSRRGWATLASFAAQALAVAVLLAIPLFYTGALPQLQKLEVVNLPHFEAPAAMPVIRQSTVPLSNMSGDRLIAPLSVPREIQHVEETAPPPPVNVTGIPGGTRQGGGNGSPIEGVIRRILRGSGCASAGAGGTYGEAVKDVAGQPDPPRGTCVSAAGQGGRGSGIGGPAGHDRAGRRD